MIEIITHQLSNINLLASLRIHDDFSYRKAKGFLFPFALNQMSTIDHWSIKQSIEVGESQRLIALATYLGSILKCCFDSPCPLEGTFPSAVAAGALLYSHGPLGQCMGSVQSNV